MSVSIIDVQCSECKETYKGYTKDLPMVGVIYSSSCPHCGASNEVSDKAGWINQSIPEGAVEFKVGSSV